MQRLAIVITLAAAALVFGVAVRYGTFVAFDTDPYGYISEAELIARGRLTIDQRFALSMPWREADASFVPPGHKQGTTPGVVVPVYPPGLPMLMALFLRVTGMRDAVFYVVPVLAALVVVLTALLGRILHSWTLGAAAAVLLASSPSFLYQATQPVSDVPAAAWWTLSLVLVLQSTAWTAAGAGIAAALAILTRPNLVPLAAVLGAFCLLKAARADKTGRKRELARAVAFSAPVVAGCLAVAAFNNSLYGSPVRSGYAPFSELYQWMHVPLNLDRYPRWLAQTQTPLIYLAVIAPWLARHRSIAWLLLTFALGVFLSYIPYGYFGRDEWGYLRFLLPAYPSLIVLMLVAIYALARRIVRHRASLAAVSIAFIVLLASWQLREARGRSVFLTHEIEQRYADVGRYIAAGLPRDAVFVAGLHAGSIRYYSDRLTLYYPRLHFRALNDAVTALAGQGRKTYIVLDEGEAADFRWHFADNSEIGRLDWPPVVRSSRGVRVNIFDPADRARFLAGEPIVTYDLHSIDKPVVTQK